MINCIKVPNDDPRHKDSKQADPNEFVMGAHSINSIRVCYHNSESLLSRFFELKDNLMRRKVLSTEAQPNQIRHRRPHPCSKHSSSVQTRRSFVALRDGENWMLNCSITEKAPSYAPYLQ